MLKKFSTDLRVAYPPPISSGLSLLQFLDLRDIKEMFQGLGAPEIWVRLIFRKGSSLTFQGRAFPKKMKRLLLFLTAEPTCWIGGLIHDTCVPSQPSVSCNKLDYFPNLASVQP